MPLRRHRIKFKNRSLWAPRRGFYIWVVTKDEDLIPVFCPNPSYDAEFKYDTNSSWGSTRNMRFLQTNKGEQNSDFVQTYRVARA